MLVYPDQTQPSEDYRQLARGLRELARGTLRPYARQELLRLSGIYERRAERLEGTLADHFRAMWPLNLRLQTVPRFAISSQMEPTLEQMAPVVGREWRLLCHQSAGVTGRIPSNPKLVVAVVDVESRRVRSS
jgi:hypothetical protein